MRKAEKGTGVTEKKLGIRWDEVNEEAKREIEKKCKCISMQDMYEGVH